MVPSWQGVGLGDDLVFVGLRSAQVAALDRDTGELVWATTVGSMPPQAGEGVTTAPMVARGKVFVGLANGDSGGQGRVIALDAATGETAWTFFVVPRPGEPGHETWPQDSEVWRLGGGGVWLVGTVDPDLGLVYFSTGNPVPMFGGRFGRGTTCSRRRCSRWTWKRASGGGTTRWCATTCGTRTSRLRCCCTRRRWTVCRGRRWRRCGRDGYLFLFDRETGEPLLEIEEREVPQDAFLHTAPTQPFRWGRRASCRTARSGATGCRRRSS